MINWSQGVLFGVKLVPVSSFLQRECGLELKSPIPDDPRGWAAYCGVLLGRAYRHEMRDAGL
jgi:hypothetical protein